MTTSSSSSSSTIRCGFCANFGLPERIVSTHLVRDCKKLANTKCLQCGELGHTIGRCHLNMDTKPKYSRKSASRKPFVVRDQARKTLPTKPEVDADGFQLQRKKGSGCKTNKVTASVIMAAVPTSFGGEVTIDPKMPEQSIAQAKLEQLEQNNAKGAWAAGAPKHSMLRGEFRIRPYQEIQRANQSPKPSLNQYPATQSTGGNYANETVFPAPNSWADDDGEMDQNDPFFQ